MGYDKTQVFDVEAERTGERPIDVIARQITKAMQADAWFTKAHGYALGRMHYEAAPLEDADGRDDEAGSAAGFGLLYQRMMVDFTERRRTSVLDIDVAWANYAGSLGGTIEP